MIRELLKALDIPVVINFYTIISLVFIALSIFFIIAIFTSQSYKRVQRFLRKIYVAQIQNSISEMVIQASVSDEPDADQRVRFQLLSRLRDKSPYLTQVIIDEMMSMKKNLAGESADFLIGLYRELELKRMSLEKLESGNWKDIAKGVRELELMRQTDTFGKVRDFLNHKNYLLRKEARLALVSLAPKPLNFFQVLREELTEWEQILIYQKLRMLDKEKIPDFSLWYNHPMLSVVIFSVKMTVRFGQIHSTKELLKLLVHPLMEVRVEVIKALTSFESFESLRFMKKVLKRAQYPQEIIACLRFMRKLGTDEEKAEVLPFVIASDRKIALEAVGALNGIGLNDSDKRRINPEMLAHFQHELLV